MHAATRGLLSGFGRKSASAGRVILRSTKSHSRSSNESLCKPTWLQRCESSYRWSRSYSTEYRTPPEYDIYNQAKPPSMWNYLWYVLPATCFYLAYWQWERLEWKNNLIRTRELGLQAEPMPLDLEHNDYDPVTFPRELAWKPVSVSGTWLHHKEILVGPRVLDSKGGYHVITPLELSNGDRILVNRGFVPTEKKDRNLRSEGSQKGVVEVKGTLREIQPKPSWVPENEPEKNLWYWVDIPAMALKAQTEPYFMESLLDTERPTQLPIGGQLHQPLPNNHFTYLITWFTLGAILCGMSYHVVRRGRLPSTARLPYVVPPKHRRKDMWFL